MDPNVNAQLDKLVKSFSEFKETQYKFNTDCTTKLDKISRGLYGDKDNAQDGVIERLEDHDDRLGALHGRIKVVERQQYKTGVWLAVASALMVGIIEFFKSLWK